MKVKKYIPLLLGLIGVIVYVLYRNIADIGLCPNTAQLNDGSLFCESTIGYGDYLWPMWHFSRALVVVGILILVRPALFLRLAVWTGVSFFATLIGVLLAHRLIAISSYRLKRKGLEQPFQRAI